MTDVLNDLNDKDFLFLKTNMIFFVCLFLYFGQKLSIHTLSGFLIINLTSSGSKYVLPNFSKSQVRHSELREVPVSYQVNVLFKVYLSDHNILMGQRHSLCNYSQGNSLVIYENFISTEIGGFWKGFETAL